ncbi:DUF6529 family protein [Streptomyces sp. NPDC058701]|uniref:DUF6529 family protein n=1 Tax=Streptomyces sp. NPDC058701 TaxID=3346608 RepID=UPI0036680E39
MAAENNTAALQSKGGGKLAGAVLLGAFVAVALGAYGSTHEGTGRPLALIIGFSGMAPMKAWLATAGALLAVVQVISAAWMWQRVRSWGPPPAVIAPLHRWSGTIAFLLTLPVAYHCLWSIGFVTFDTRTTVHSLLGCAFYGAFATKMLALRSNGLPKWTLPVFGGLLFTALIGLWLTASVWYFSQSNAPLF